MNDKLNIQEKMTEMVGICTSHPSFTGIMGHVEIRINGKLIASNKNYISTALLEKLSASLVGAPTNNIRPGSLFNAGWHAFGHGMNNKDGIVMRIRDHQNNAVYRTLVTTIESYGQPQGARFKGEATAAGVSGSSGTAPTAEFSVTNSPVQESDPCSGSGTNKTYVQYPSPASQYCFTLPNNNKDVIALVLVNHINNNVPGLSATNLGGSDPVIRVTSTNISAADNGKEMILLVPAALEPSPTIFSNYTMTLSGGIDPTSNASIDAVYLGRDFNNSPNAFSFLFSHLTAINSNLNFNYFLENDDFITINWDIVMTT